MKKTLLILTSAILFTGCSTNDFIPKYFSEENDNYKVMYGKGSIKYIEQFPEEGKISYSTGYNDGCRDSKLERRLKKDLIYNSNYYYNMGYDDGVLTCKSGASARNYSN